VEEEFQSDAGTAGIRLDIFPVEQPVFFHEAFYVWG
jgi:hypothetical protein